MTFLLFLLATLLIPVSGAFLAYGLFGRQLVLSPLERLTYSFALGIFSLDASMLSFDAAGIRLTPSVMLVSMTALPIAAAATRVAISRLRGRTEDVRTVPTTPGFTSTERLLFVILIGLTVLLKTVFLTDSGLPTATDLGHHMYWAKQIVDTGTLPTYAKREIVDIGDGHVALSDPEPISDFIIGEHLPFSAVAGLSGATFFSAFPVSFLLFINVLTAIAVFLFAARAASRLPLPSGLTPLSAGLAVLFFAGPLFAIASPQAKFVSGGVIGNLFGNFLIPLILLALLRAFADRDPRALSLGVLLSFTLAYTHHLSSLVLAFIIVATALSLLIFSLHDPLGLARRVIAPFCSPHVWLAFAFAAAFFAFVAAPTYIETHAANTAIGTPSKSTRTGLTLAQVSESAGTARMALGLAGLVIGTAITRIRRSDAFPFLFGWAVILLVMSIRPHLVFLDIPSNRIGSYLSFPFSVLAGLFLAAFPAILRDTSDRPRLYLPGQVFLFSSLVLFSFSAWNGSQDNQASLAGNGKAQETLEVFHATRYIADRSEPADLLLKDHNYLVADAWMKLFFMRDYAYPLSRGYFKRYEDETNPREQCTLRMISTPNLREGRSCFEDLGVNLLAVHPAHDAAQFEKSHDFSRIYAAPSIQLYERIIP